MQANYCLKCDEITAGEQTTEKHHNCSIGDHTETDLICPGCGGSLKAVTVCDECQDLFIEGAIPRDPDGTEICISCRIFKSQEKE